MIAERNGGTGAPRDIVRASGFGTVADLRGRLPAELRSIHLEKAPGTHPYAKAVAAYFEGDMKALLSIPHRQAGTNFNREVWRAMSKVRAGKTVSYKELAAASGNPTAVRAAGTACAQNLLCLLVPCHRVVKSDGSTGAYFYGPDVKESLLRLEGMKVD